MNEAHNDYLQLLVETGVAGFAVMLWFLWLLYRNALPQLENWTTEINGAVTLACLVRAGRSHYSPRVEAAGAATPQPDAG